MRVSEELLCSSSFTLITTGRIETYQTATYSIRTFLMVDYWSPKHVELLNVMNKINHQILCILLDYGYIKAYVTALVPTGISVRASDVFVVLPVGFPFVVVERLKFVVYTEISFPCFKLPYLLNLILKLCIWKNQRTERLLSSKNSLARRRELFIATEVRLSCCARNWFNFPFTNGMFVENSGDRFHD